MIRRIAAAALVLLTALVVAGCSQAAALAPVGGNRLTVIRFASNDVLVSKGVDVMTAPVCTMVDRNVTCTGATLKGEVITVKSSAADEADMDVLVGTTNIFHGAVQDVLNAGAEPTS